MVAIGCGNDALKFVSSVMAIVVWRPAVEEWQYRSILDKLLFAAPRWVLARLGHRPKHSSSRAVGSAREETETKTKTPDVTNDEEEDEEEDKLLFTAPRWVLARLGRRPKHSSRTVGFAREENPDVTNDEDEEEDNVEHESSSLSETASTLPTEETIPLSNQTIAIDENEVEV
eukprot:jgi/Psemu1/306124/fgenesh1_kg.235_\